MFFVVLLFIGLYLLVKGSDYLVESSSDIARHFGISELVIGLTLVSLGTSMPEFGVSIVASFCGHADVSLGNIVGSNIYNILVITGLIGFITRYHFKSSEILNRDIFWMLITSIWLTLTALDGYIGADVGVLFISSYLVYLIFLYNQNKEKKVVKEAAVTLKTYFLFLFSIILIYFGAKLTVENAILLADAFGFTKWAISASLIGAGTGFPETVTSLVALRKRKLKISLGNIIGSNVFNILVVVGFSSLASPLVFNFNEVVLSFVFMLVASVLLAFWAIKGSFHKKEALVAFCLYLLYLYLLYK